MCCWSVGKILKMQERWEALEWIKLNIVEKRILKIYFKEYLNIKEQQ